IKIEVEIDVPSEAIVSGSDSELREALINLIFNAVDAMPSGGTIVIRGRLEPDQIALEVQDSGIGMSEQVRQRCLEPFFSTKGERGTGLGLGMVYGIIQRHQGTLEVASTLGHGTTMTLRFPKVLPLESIDASPATLEPSAQQQHVLVV